MYTLRNKLTVLAAGRILAVVGTLMNSRQATAQNGGPAVTIGAPLPLPVSLTGSNAITGKVQVENTPTSAVPTVAAPAASQLYTAQCTGGYNGSFNAQCTFPLVPAGQTLFIETESIRSTSEPGADPTEAFLAVGPEIFVPMIQQASLPGFADNFTGTVAGKVFSRGGTTGPICIVNLNKNSITGGGITCSISGYLAPAQ